MKRKLINITVVLCACFFMWSNTLFADEGSCQSEYKQCVKNNFDKHWEHWDTAHANMSHDEFDTIHINHQNSIFACDEITLACKENRKPNFEKYLNRIHSYPEADWAMATAEDEGVDNTKLQKAISTAASISNFRSILVVKNGKLLTENYYSRKDDPRPQHVQSITKSITSLLIGIAIDQGMIESEKLEIKPYFPEFFSKPHDERKQKITIEELLAMSSRLNFADHPVYSTYENTASWSDPGAWRAYWYSDNYYDDALHTDLIESEKEIAPLYNTPACNLLTSILKKSTNMTSKEFADKYLFGPLGIKNYHWFHDSNYNYIGGHTLFIRPRDLARIGQMILDEGKYEGRQIVSKQWLDKSFSPYVTEFVKTDDAKTAFDYGYLWWLGEYGGYKYQFGWGFGGQFLFMVPEANALVVTTAYPDTDGTSHWERSQKIIQKVMFGVIDALPK